ncbi:hypothetical protein JW898_02910 [Candidatus Woesearchaeota archaeon]|nr:hypothetical protein [Candidatus Woesearchaeota archaeon]
MKCSRAVALVSSGIDSPVAVWLMRRKGVEIIGVHCSNGLLAPPGSADIVKALCRKVGIRKLYIIRHGELVQDNLVRGCQSSLICILCKRFMFRIAEAVARKEGCCCLVTGDNLGQVASQTLDNLVVVSDAVQLPILRPLLCNDKQEIVDIAKRIGTYDVGGSAPASCSIVPKGPATRAALSRVLEEERKFDVDRIVQVAVSTAEVVDL